MGISQIVRLLVKYLKRNKYSMQGLAKPNEVNIEWWSTKQNIGDALSPVVCNYMLEKRGINPEKHVCKTKHLYAIGSVIGVNEFDATIWGSGILGLLNLYMIIRYQKYVKYDIRAIRGPLTKEILRFAGYNIEGCPMGDPAVLMPFIYAPAGNNKNYKYTIILHHSVITDNLTSGDHYLSVETDNYVQFIDEISQSEIVISSSLHGIILAESYGVPAIFLLQGEQVENQLFKYYDWYFSTGRYNVKIAKSIQEAKEMEPMPLPELSTMQANLERCFPFDLWEE